MGSTGLATNPKYETVMAVAGGEGERYLEVVARGTVAYTTNVLRTAAVESGSFVAARNPLPVHYIQEHAAVGAISYALALGEAMLAAGPEGEEAVIETITGRLGDRITVRSPGCGKRPRGASTSAVSLVGDTELSFVNEYMTVEAGGERLATFPDLITTLSPETGNPVSVAQLREGREVCVLVVDKDRVPLGSGVREPSGSPEVEAMTARSSGAMLWHREVPDRGTLR